jgi:hypothetical protein
VKDQLLRLYAEFEYTNQYAYYFWGEFAHNVYGGNYPYIYYGKTIGSALGSEATGYTVGAILNEDDGSSDSLMVRYIKLNEYDFNSYWGYPFDRQDVLWLSVNRAFMLPYGLGRLSGQLGYLQSLNGSGLKSTPSAYISWTKNF